MPDKRGIDECPFYSLSLSLSLSLAEAEQNIKQWKQAMFELSLSPLEGCCDVVVGVHWLSSFPLHASLSNTKAASFFIPLTHAFLMQQFKPSAYSCVLTWHLPLIPAQRLSQARGSQWSCGVTTGWVWPCCPCLFCLWRCSINKQRFLQLYILYQYWNEEHMPLRFSNQ